MKNNSKFESESKLTDILHDLSKSCNKINQKLNECTNFHSENKILCGEIYKALKICNKNVSKLKV
jgi:hypothetical protein